MRSYRGYIFDMDGVIYRGDEPIQDAVKTVNVLKERGCKLMYITNNSAKLASEYRSLLLSIGIAPPLDEEDIITSGDVTAKYLEDEMEKYPERKNVLCVGQEPMKHLMRKIGMKVIEPEDYRNAHYVVVGLYHDFDWKIGSQAADAIATYGAKLIGANPDPARPVENGEIEAGTGAIIAFIEIASHTKAIFMGKPYPQMYKMALRRMNLEIPHALMVGDMLLTDVKGALDLGMDAALVLTGMTLQEDVESSEVKPTYVIGSLGELILDV